MFCFLLFHHQLYGSRVLKLTFILFRIWGLSGKSPAIVNTTKHFVWHRCNPAPKESGLECTCVNNDNVTVLVREAVDAVDVYCVAITLNMTEWVEQQICIKFWVKLEHSSMESIRMIQKAFGDNAMSAEQMKVLKVIHIPEGLYQAEYLTMLKVWRLQKAKISDWQREN